MRIVTRYRSIFSSGYAFDDGLLENLRRYTVAAKDSKERFLFKGGSYVFGLSAMRVVDDKTNAKIETIDAELEELHKRLKVLRQERRELLAKGYPKFKKVYKWDLEDVR